MAEVYTNGFTTTLTAAFNAGDTALHVAGAAPVAVQTGTFRVRLGTNGDPTLNTLLVVTAGANGTTWTVSTESGTANWPIGAVVYGPEITSGFLDNLRKQTTGLQGVTVATTTPTDGQVLTYVSASTDWEPKTPSQSATKLQGVNVATTSPTNGQVLTYVSASSDWRPQTPSTGGSSGPVSFTTLTDGATVTWDTGGAAICNAAISLAHTRATRSLTLTNLAAGATGTLIVSQDSTGGATLIPTQTPTVSLAPTLNNTINTGANAIDLWRWVYDGTKLYWEVFSTYRTFNPVKHKYWRLMITDCLGGNTVAISEWAIFDSSSTRISTGGTAVASSEYATPTYNAAKAFDNNNATFWDSAGTPGGGSTEWLQYTFASAVSPSTFTIRNRSDIVDQEPTTFRLEYSDDNANWFTQNSYTCGAWTTVGQTQTFTV